MIEILKIGETSIQVPEVMKTFLIGYGIYTGVVVLIAFVIFGIVIKNMFFNKKDGFDKHF